MKTNQNILRPTAEPQGEEAVKPPVSQDQLLSSQSIPDQGKTTYDGESRLSRAEYSTHWNQSHDEKWNTPKSLLALLDGEFHFDYDPAQIGWDGSWDTSIENEAWEWGQRNYVNPPYNNPVVWIEKALVERDRGKLTVFLLMANTTTRWFSRLWAEANEIRFIYPRVNYGDNKSSAPWGSIIAVIRPEKTPLECFRYKWKPCKMDSNPLGTQGAVGS